MKSESSTSPSKRAWDMEKVEKFLKTTGIITEILEKFVKTDGIISRLHDIIHAIKSWL